MTLELVNKKVVRLLLKSIYISLKLPKLGRNLIGIVDESQDCTTGLEGGLEGWIGREATPSNP